MIPNLRDIAETVNGLTGENKMIEGQLFRGGTVNDSFDSTDLPPIKTIINLRTGSDKEFPNIKNIHLPAIDTIDNYSTENHKVKYWANRVLSSMNSPKIFPALMHCTAGKDRTGVITALILKIIGIEEAIIIEEYLQSEGVKGSNDIIQSLNGFGTINDYILNPSIIPMLKQQLLSVPER